MSFLNNFENETLNTMLGGVAYTPKTWYVGLSTTTPAEDGTNITEPVGNGYARVAVGSFGAAASGEISNAAQITMGPASGGNWGTLTHMVLFDDPAAGSPHVVLEITDGLGTPTPVAVNDGQSYVIAAGELVVRQN